MEPLQMVSAAIAIVTGFFKLIAMFTNQKSGDKNPFKNPKYSFAAMLLFVVFGLVSIICCAVDLKSQIVDFENYKALNKQWYFKVVRLTIKPNTNNGNEPISRFRLIFNMNGIQHGYPINQDTITAGEAQQAIWPLQNGVELYRMAVTGYLRRTNMDANMSGRELIEVSRKDLPLKGQHYEMIVSGTKLGFADSKVEIDYEIVSEP